MRLPEPPSFRLDGKSALVTGASSGIGLACAVALAEAGASVTLAARSESVLAEIANEFRQKGWQAAPLCLDVADVVSVERQIDAYGPFDILLNSAGAARHGLAVASG